MAQLVTGRMTYEEHHSSFMTDIFLTKLDYGIKDLPNWEVFDLTQCFYLFIFERVFHFTSHKGIRAG